MKKKPQSNQQGEGNHLAAMETEVFRDLMSLVEHCATRKYDDGDPREPGWFTVGTRGGAWAVTVKDPDSSQSFTMVGDSLDAVLANVHLHLACDDAPWESDDFLAERKRKARRK